MKNAQPAAVPMDSDHEKLLRARRFNQIVAFSSVILAIRCLVSLVNQSWTTVSVLLTGLTAMLVCAWLHKRDKTTAATLGLLSALILMITALIWTSEGLFDAAMLAYPVILLLGGLLLQRRHFLVISLLMLAAIVLVAVASFANHAQFVPGPVSARLMDSVVILAVGGFAVWVVTNDLQEILQMLKAEVVRVRQSQVELQAKEQKLQLIFESSPVAMAVFDVAPAADGRIDFQAGLVFLNINDAWEQGFRCRRKDVIGTLSRGRFWAHAADRLRYIELLKRDRRVDDLETTLVREDGTQFLASISARFANIDKEPVLIMTVEDVSERRRIEREIRELNADLESRVAHRTEDLQRSNQELASTMESLRTAQGELVRVEKMAALGSLVAGVAHELNTPIGNALMAATTLREHFDEFKLEIAADGLRRSSLDGFFATIDSATDIAVRGLERSAHLVSSFKQVAMDPSSAQREPFNLAQLIEQLVALLQPRLQETPYSIELQIAEPLEMESYPGVVEQVLTHLIDNAILHGFAGRDHGRIELHAEAIADDMIRLRVRDDGQGIAAEVQPRIFDPFFTTRFGQGGSGLGLHITHNAVTQILAGRLSVISQPGAGCEFVLELPRVVAVG